MFGKRSLFLLLFLLSCAGSSIETIDLPKQNYILKMTFNATNYSPAFLNAQVDSFLYHFKLPDHSLEIKGVKTEREFTFIGAGADSLLKQDTVYASFQLKNRYGIETFFVQKKDSVFMHETNQPTDWTIKTERSPSQLKIYNDSRLASNKIDNVYLKFDVLNSSEDSVYQEIELFKKKFTGDTLSITDSLYAGIFRLEMKVFSGDTDSVSMQINQLLLNSTRIHTNANEAIRFYEN